MKPQIKIRVERVGRPAGRGKISQISDEIASSFNQHRLKNNEVKVFAFPVPTLYRTQGLIKALVGPKHFFDICGEKN
jgi:hypothetical protein